jgi:hypothetical protein
MRVMLVFFLALLLNTGMNAQTQTDDAIFRPVVSSNTHRHLTWRGDWTTERIAFTFAQFADGSETKGWVEKKRHLFFMPLPPRRIDLKRVDDELRRGRKQ